MDKNNPESHVVEFKAGMLPSNDNIKYKFLFWTLLLICLGLLILRFVEYVTFGYEREIVIVHKCSETAAYDLFDKQFTHLLTTISVLLGVFGIAVPFIAYLMQRETLKDERTRMMADVASHEKQLIEQIETLRQEVAKSSTELKTDYSTKINKMETIVTDFSNDKRDFENQIVYRFGMHLFLSANILPDASMTKIMFWIYALEQFGLIPLYKDSMKMIGSILANFTMIEEQLKKQHYLSIHWQYRLDALRILRKLAENKQITPNLRTGVSKLAKIIYKIKSQKCPVTMDNDDDSTTA